jgi:hypothetical protein
VKLSQTQKDAALRYVLEVIDRVEAELLEIVSRDHPLIRDGRVVTDPATGKPVFSHSPRPADNKSAELRKQRDPLWPTATPKFAAGSVMRRCVRVAVWNRYSRLPPWVHETHPS